MKYFNLLTIIAITLLSCTKVFYIDSDNAISAFDRKIKTDADLIQHLLDNNLVVQLENREYNVDKTIYLYKYFHQLKGGGSTLLNFSGTGSALAFRRSTNGNFSTMCQVRDLSIVIKNSNCIGLEILASHSTFDNISIGIIEDNSTGFKIMGDKNGTGSYYNIFTKCSVQGNTHMGKKNQIGINLAFEAAVPNRCPNANSFYGGRIGQVGIGILLTGCGNTFYSPVLEGITERCFEFDHPSSPVGCVGNNIYSPYIEGADGVNVAYFGKNASDCHVINPFVTSIGTTGRIEKNERLDNNNSLITH